MSNEADTLKGHRHLWNDIMKGKEAYETAKQDVEWGRNYLAGTPPPSPHRNANESKINIGKPPENEKGRMGENSLILGVSIGVLFVAVLLVYNQRA